MKFLLIYPNSTGNTKVPLGIVYILVLLRDEGHEVRLFDMSPYGVEVEKHTIHMRGRNLNFRPIDLTPYGVTHQRASMKDVERDLANDLLSFQPDLVGVSITEDTSWVGFRLAGVSKRVLPEVPTIFGGVFCMTMPERVMSQEVTDIVCVGEGEQAIVELAARLQQGRDITDVAGLWMKTASGEIIRNELGFPTDLDSLPFADPSLVSDIHHYSPMAGHVYKMTWVEGQRGCPRRCSYCCNQVFLDAYWKYRKHYLRRKSVPRLIDELRYLKDTHEFNFFQFTDDDFLFRPEAEIIEFGERYRCEVGLPFWIQGEANHVTEVKIAALKEAGCMGVATGIETGSDFIREHVYKRRTSKETTILAFDILHRYGIRTSGNIIIGVPHEGRTEIFESVELARRCRPRSLTVNLFAPYCGTKLRDECVNMGYLEKDFLRESSVAWQAVLNMPQITGEEMEGLARTFVLYATLPRKYWPEIEKCERPSSESDRIFSKLERIYWEIAETQGIDYDVPGFDYDALLAKRQKELAERAERTPGSAVGGQRQS